MKQSAIILLFTFFCGGLMAQKGLSIGSLKVKKIGVFLGGDKDLLSSMDHQYFLSMTDNAVAEKYNDLYFDQNSVYSMVCENPHIRLTATLLPATWSKTEIRVALNGIFNRVDGISYYNEGSGWYGDSEYFDFNTYTNEVGVEIAIIKRFGVKGWQNKFGDSPINFYGGVGTNAGYSFNNELYVYGRSSAQTPADAGDGATIRNNFEEYVEDDYFYESMELKDGIQQRVFVQAGVGFTIFNRVEIGVEGRYGYGYRAMFGAPVKRTNLQSLGFFANYVLR